MWQSTPYDVPLAVAATIALASAAVVWRQRDSDAETWAVAAQLSIAAWAGLQLLLLSARDFDLKLLAFGLFVPTIAALVVTVLGFTLHYTGRGEWLTRRRVAALVAYPAVVLAASLTNPVHWLVLRDPGLDASGEFALLTYEYGPLFVLAVLVAYAISAVYAALLLVKVRRSRNVYRTYAAVLFVAVVLLTAGTVVSVAGLSPVPQFVLLPLAYLGVGTVMLLSAVSFRFVRLLPVDRFLAWIGGQAGGLVPLARDYVVEAIDNGIVVLDEGGRIVDINGTGKRMLATDRAVGRHVRDVAREDVILEGGPVPEFLADDGPIREMDDEVWVETPDGERCYEVAITGIDGSGGDTVGYVALLHDITDRKRREETLREREHELERRTATLEAQTRKLELQNERLDEFASVVSHDLRNPLNVASGYAELVVEQAANGAQVDAADARRIIDAHGRMDAIVENALELARQGQAITETEPVGLESVVAEAWGNVETAGANLAVEDEVQIRADRDRLLTVFENLLRNSVEHAGPDVTVSVGRLAGGSGFFLADDGPGIPEAERSDVLEHGYTASGDGTGLGLAVVRDVARAHGWSLRVTESRDGGARFEFDDVE